MQTSIIKLLLLITISHLFIFDSEAKITITRTKQKRKDLETLVSEDSFIEIVEPLEVIYTIDDDYFTIEEFTEYTEEVTVPNEEFTEEYTEEFTEPNEELTEEYTEEFTEPNEELTEEYTEEFTEPNEELYTTEEITEKVTEEIPLEFAEISLLNTENIFNACAFSGNLTIGHFYEGIKNIQLIIPEQDVIVLNSTNGPDFTVHIEQVNTTIPYAIAHVISRVDEDDVTDGFCGVERSDPSIVQALRNARPYLEKARKEMAIGTDYVTEKIIFINTVVADEEPVEEPTVSSIPLEDGPSEDGYAEVNLYFELDEIRNIYAIGGNLERDTKVKVQDIDIILPEQILRYPGNGHAAAFTFSVFSSLRTFSEAEIYVKNVTKVSDSSDF